MARKCQPVIFRGFYFAVFISIMVSAKEWNAGGYLTVRVAKKIDTGRGTGNDNC